MIMKKELILMAIMIMIIMILMMFQFLQTLENALETEAQFYNLDSPSQFKVDHHQLHHHEHHHHHNQHHQHQHLYLYQQKHNLIKIIKSLKTEIFSLFEERCF